MLLIEVLADHPAVVQNSAVGQAQGWDFPGWIALVELGNRTDRRQVDGLQRHSVGLPGLVQYHQDFAHERRSR
ncbi:hypothetical protein D3C72_2082680 [compost metagenome]